MTHPFTLTDKKILITGASSGLGKQTAITVSRLGAQVIITGRNPEKLNETFVTMDPCRSHVEHLQITADLTVQREIDELTDQLPVLNGVVFSVGISDLLPTKFLTGKDLEKNFSVSFNAAVLLMAALQKRKKLQRQHCSILFISSISTRYPFVGGAMYISAKAAMEAYARVLGLELLPKGIRVNCISPGFVRGPMFDETQEKISAETIAKIEERQPLGLGEPEDVANTIVFYLSDASRWVTGTNLFLGGG